METFMSAKFGRSGLTVLACGLIIGWSSPPAGAQRPGMGGGGGAGAHKPPKQSNPPPQQQQPKPKKDLATGNNEILAVIKFTPAKEGTDGVAGTLSGTLVDGNTQIMLEVAGDATVDFNG